MALLNFASRKLLLSFASVAAGLVFWQILSSSVFESVLFPTAAETISTLVSQVHDGLFLGELRATGSRVLVGFVIGSVAGTVVGLVMGSVSLIRRFLDPYLNFFRFVTPIAWIAPATIWFGIGETAKLFLVVYATIFIVVINTMVGVTHIHKDRLRMSRVFGASPWQVFAWITIPASIPFILVGMRIGLGNSFMTVIGAEMLSGSDGLGFLIYSSRVFYRSDVMFATIIVLGALGFLADRIFVFAQRRLFARYEAGR